MLKHAVAVVVVARLVAAPWAAAQEPPVHQGVIAASAAREAARSAVPVRRGPMPKALKWTGVALILAGGATIFSTAIGNCGDYCDDRAVGYAVGGAEFFAGSVLIGIADRRRPVLAPSLVVRDGRALVLQRVTF
jgi:hypothetical protein